MITRQHEPKVSLTTAATPTAVSQNGDGDTNEFGMIPVAFFLSIMSAIEAREPFSRRRSRNVALYAVATARALLLPTEMIDAIRIGALLSNVGMLSVPEQILQKSEALTEEEQQIVRQHPVLGAEILSPVPQLRAILPMVLHHHEDYAGGGYPVGLNGEQIPIGARIIRVVDTYEALISPRPYRPPYPAAEALQVLAAGSDRQFDSRIVAAFTICMQRGSVQDEVLDRWDELRAANRAWQTLMDVTG